MATFFEIKYQKSKKIEYMDLDNHWFNCKNVLSFYFIVRRPNEIEKTQKNFLCNFYDKTFPILIKSKKIEHMDLDNH